MQGSCATDEATRQQPTQKPATERGGSRWPGGCAGLCRQPYWVVSVVRTRTESLREISVPVIPISFLSPCGRTKESLFPDHELHARTMQASRYAEMKCRPRGCRPVSRTSQPFRTVSQVSSFSGRRLWLRRGEKYDISTACRLPWKCPLRSRARRTLMPCAR